MICCVSHILIQKREIITILVLILINLCLHLSARGIGTSSNLGVTHDVLYQKRRLGTGTTQTKKN